MSTLKLYKRTRTGLRYWCAFEFYGTVIVQEGRVGERGKQKVLAAAEDQSEAAFIEEIGRKARACGFEDIAREDHIDLVVQYPRPADKPVTKAERIQEVLNACLGITGNGRCTGNDIGTSTINLFCIVVEPAIAAASIEEYLRQRRLIKGAVIAVDSGEGYRPTYPKRFRRKFML
jgi:hypothetical protein